MVAWSIDWEAREMNRLRGRRPHEHSGASRWSSILLSVTVGAIIGALVGFVGFHLYDYHGPTRTSRVEVMAMAAAWAAILGAGREATTAWRRQGGIKFYLAWALSGTVAMGLIALGLQLWNGSVASVIGWDTALLILIAGPGPGMAVGWWMRCWGLE